MSNHYYIDKSISALGASSKSYALLRRNEREFMALPENRVAAVHTLGLYQPQKLKAILAMKIVRLLTIAGLHRFFLPANQLSCHSVAVEPALPGLIPGTVGVMLGSPEHRVRRAIVSYQTFSGWEVAKLAFGPNARILIEGEFSALQSMPFGVQGIPSVLGVHHGDELSLLRLPYLSGRPLATSESARAIELLDYWVRPLPLRLISDFPEWPSICSALETTDSGRAAITRMAELKLRPVIRHGDFARWNLLKINEGVLIAIDWEWGCAEGMPGIDLVHFFAQNARLVELLSPLEVVRRVERMILADVCDNYVKVTGWKNHLQEMILASIAFTVGTKQQSNELVLEAALSLFDS